MLLKIKEASKLAEETEQKKNEDEEKAKLEQEEALLRAQEVAQPFCPYKQDDFELKSFS